MTLCKKYPSLREAKDAGTVLANNYGFESVRLSKTIISLDKEIGANECSVLLAAGYKIVDGEPTSHLSEGFTLRVIQKFHRTRPLI